MEAKHDELVIYQSEDGLIKVDVLFENETVWLTQQQMAVLFGKATSTINEHIKNIYKEGELREEEHFQSLKELESDLKSLNP